MSLAKVCEHHCSQTSLVTHWLVHTKLPGLMDRLSKLTHCKGARKYASGWQKIEGQTQVKMPCQCTAQVPTQYMFPVPFISLLEVTMMIFDRQVQHKDNMAGSRGELYLFWRQATCLVTRSPFSNHKSSQCWLTVALMKVLLWGEEIFSWHIACVQWVR